MKKRWLPASWHIITKSYQWQFKCGCSLTSCPGHHMTKEFHSMRQLWLDRRILHLDQRVINSDQVIIYHAHLYQISVRATVHRRGQLWRHIDRQNKPVSTEEIWRTVYLRRDLVTVGHVAPLVTRRLWVRSAIALRVFWTKLVYVRKYVPIALSFRAQSELNSP